MRRNLGLTFRNDAVPHRMGDDHARDMKIHIPREPFVAFGNIAIAEEWALS